MAFSLMRPAVGPGIVSWVGASGDLIIDTELAAGAEVREEPPDARWVRVSLVALGLVAVAVYVLPGLAAPGVHWPLWDVQVYWWGGQRAAHGGTLYAPGAPQSFTYPPFAAMAFSLAAGGRWPC